MAQVTKVAKKGVVDKLDNRFSKDRKLNYRFTKAYKPVVHFLNNARTKVIVPRQKCRRWVQNENGYGLDRRQWFHTLLYVKHKLPLLRKVDVAKNNTGAVMKTTKKNHIITQWSTELVNFGKKDCRLLVGLIIEVDEGSGQKYNKETFRNQLQVVGLSKVTGNVVRKNYKWNGNEWDTNVEKFEKSNIEIQEKDIIVTIFDGMMQCVRFVIQRDDKDLFESKWVPLIILDDFPFALVTPVVVGQNFAVSLNEYSNYAHSLCFQAMRAVEKTGILQALPVAPDNTLLSSEPQQDDEIIMPEFVSRRMKKYNSDTRVSNQNFDETNPTASNKVVLLQTGLNGPQNKLYITSEHQYDTTGEPSFSKYPVPARRKLSNMERPLDETCFSDSEDEDYLDDYRTVMTVVDDN